MDGQTLIPGLTRSDSAAETVWGVDPSSKLIAIAWAGEQSGVVSRKFTPGLDTGARLNAIYRETHDLALEIADQYPPRLVCVEGIVVYGHKPAPILYMATGCIHAALSEALSVPIVTAQVKDWKLVACGRGTASKPEYLQWAQDNGYEGKSDDEAAAIGISHFALTKLA